MDIYQFFNSKDVAEYLKSLKYKFSLPEASFIVYQSEQRTLKEKFDAWQELIDTTPDCSMSRRLNMEPVTSFHCFLQDYMKLLEKVITMFYENSGAIYTYEIYEDIQIRDWASDSEFEDKSPRWSETGLYFSDAQSAIEHYKNNRKDYGDELLRVRFIRIPLQDPDLTEKQSHIQLDMTPDLEIISPEVRYQALDDADHVLFRQFDGMYFAFPTPFHRGDILVDNSVTSFLGQHRPFVLESISAWDREIPQESADSSDMTYTALYFDLYDGLVMQKDNQFWTYLNLERYDGPLQGMNRILKAAGSAMTINPQTGEPLIDANFFCNASQLILSEEMCKLNRRFMEITCTEEGLKLAGL